MSNHTSPSSSLQQVESAICSEVRCVYCGSIKPPIWVHGHYQCANCKVNIAPCCEGSAIYLHQYQVMGAES